MAGRVLVVDDEKMIVKGLKFSLMQDYSVVDCAYDGEEALEYAKNNEYDIILLDIMLPKLDGLSVCQQIREFSVVVISVISIFFALDPTSSVFKIVSFAWAGFGAAFGPVVLCSLFWKRANKYGIVSGMIAGGAMIFIWKFGIAKLGGIFAVYELLPAFIFATVVIIVVSLATGKPSQEVMDKFEEVKNMSK